MAQVTDEDLTEAIILASRAMVGIAVRSLAGSEQEVTLPQYRTLVVLTYGGPSRLADLATTLGVSPSTATRMCDRLVRKGLISRSRDDLDRREVNLTVTEAGRGAVEAVIERRRGEVQEMLRSIPAESRVQLSQSLHMLAMAAGETPEMHWTPGWQSQGDGPLRQADTA
ncbi:MAG TPA: MarR family transcriptional regulator [Acidimicrobiales bacterium]|nr:MarR family transcriptional regulator [Acidimicrobiales bacterium]